MRTPRAVVAAVAVVVVIAGGAFTVDAVSASRLEAEISARIAPEFPVKPPSVMTGGPLSRWSGEETLSSVSIRVEGVERPGLGPVAVEAVAHDVHVQRGGDNGVVGGDGASGSNSAGGGDGASGSNSAGGGDGARKIDDDDAAAPMTAESVTVSVQITGDSLAPTLGMRDLLVGAANDPSLAGGIEHRALLTGTLIESGERVAVIVDLVVDASGAHLIPVAAATGPGGVPDQDTELAMRSVALTLEPDVLPLGVPVESLSVKGGTITAAGNGGPGTPPLDDLVRGDL